MRRSLSIVLVALAISLVAGPPALAGGNWLDFRRDPSAGASPEGGRGLGTWAVVHIGQRIVAHTGVSVPNPHRRDRLQSTVFYAWLSLGEAFLRGSTLPADAIRLAAFRLDWTSRRSATARATFTVPEVPSGEYEILICDDPCTLAGLGGYVQGWISVLQTPTEARLFQLARDRKGQVRTLSQKVRPLQERVGGLEAELSALETRARTLPATSRAGAYQAPRVSADAQAGRPLMPGWAAILLAVTIAASAVLVNSRRRTPTFVVPDTIPDDLVERERETSAV